jgi:NADH-quinone oxidoreductase subunit E
MGEQPTAEEEAVLKDIAARIAEFAPDRGKLIPILQMVQQRHGYLPTGALRTAAEHLGMAACEVYGVATFYNQFRFHAPGRFHVQVCRGTACHVKGSAMVLEAASKSLGVKPGETTRDGLFSLEVVACLGACGLAPVVAVNGEFYAGITPEALSGILSDYRGKAEADGQTR